ncbi:gamma-glutamylcyclotransferase family protein [Neptuniibacter caesariensis]|uniref:Gamma-glutamylcyclotransferase n=1 Tax=Neptuniibacter caesariensis TaxID=207954 RepID=A0A7U8GT06_NEPCE|nr:gamma-glutamylcyclotransferase family protein [Neptuniibacter caesariensis]EAR61792.1 hypothetical protein MED92_04317 [Neptuniibacter caesariensis]
MFYYFGYASNMNMTSLRAKGVVPVSSENAELIGWTLKFNVRHWFRHEGGMANIEPATPDDAVLGRIHLIDEQHLAMLDAVESYGEGYDRIEVEVRTSKGMVKAITYIGLPGYLDNGCLPTQRYLNIITHGAASVGIDEAYISRLRSLKIQPPIDYPPFLSPDITSTTAIFNEPQLASNPLYTALMDAVFDMQYVRKDLYCLHSLFGGKDTTLFHCKRHDSSDGSETLKDIYDGNISESAKAYLNAYLHEYNNEFRYVGVYRPDNLC